MLNKVSNYQVGSWLDSLRTSVSYGALAFAEPHEADPFSVEVSGPGYLRQRVFWTRRGRSLYNSTVVKFSGIDVPVGIVAFMILDAENSGRLRASGVLEEPITLVDATGYTFGVGEIMLYID